MSMTRSVLQDLKRFGESQLHELFAIIETRLNSCCVTACVVSDLEHRPNRAMLVRNRRIQNVATDAFRK
jgi:hypothetical protein